MGFQNINEGQEVGSLKAILVEVIGWAIGSGYHNYTVFEEFREESLQYHGISDVGYLYKSKNMFVLNLSRFNKMWVSVLTQT